MKSDSQMLRTIEQESVGCEQAWVPILDRAVGRAAARRLAGRFVSIGALLEAVRDSECAVPGSPVDRDLARLQRAFRLTVTLLQAELAERPVLSSPGAVREFLLSHLAWRQAEAFWVLFLDSQNRLLVAQEMFRGTLSQTAVYPREIVRKALEVNAGAVIFAHNHPSGVCEPSHADRLLTDALKSALGHLEIRVLDHLIVGTGGNTMSFAEQGLM